MKRNKNIKIENNRFSLFLSVLLVFFALSLTIIIPNVHAQQTELSLADVIIALRSNKVTLAERNEILKDAVEERGVTFSITPQIEKELESTGANKFLLDAIRKKGTIVKIAAAPEPQTAPAEIQFDFAYFKKTADENFVKGELDSAMTNYDKAIGLNSENSSVYVNRGLTFLKKKDYQKAIADFSKAIDLNENELSAYSNRANAYETIGETEKAVADYKKILKLDGSNSAANAALNRFEEEKAREIQKQKEQDAIAAEAEKEKIKKEAEAAEKLPAAEVKPKAPEIIDLGRISNTMATDMVMPVYTDVAKSLNLQGQITVRVTIDEKGNVTSAEAADGHQILRDIAEKAARRSKFKPAMFGDTAIKSKGFIVYSFVR